MHRQNARKAYERTRVKEDLARAREAEERIRRERAEVEGYKREMRERARFKKELIKEAWDCWDMSLKES